MTRSAIKQLIVFSTVCKAVFHQINIPLCRLFQVLMFRSQGASFCKVLRYVSDVNGTRLRAKSIF